MELFILFAVYLAVRPPLSVLTDISTHLTKIEEFLLSYHSATTAQKASILTEYKTELRAILSLIKLHKITIASFKLRHDAGGFMCFILVGINDASPEIIACLYDANPSFSSIVLYCFSAA